MKKTIVFDMDGIIFDTENMILNIWREVADKNGIENIDETLKMCLGVNVAETKKIFLKAYGCSFAYDDFRKEADSVFREKVKNEGIPVKTGAKELLEYLKEEKYSVGLASSTKTEIAKEELYNAGLICYFDKIIGGDMVKASKPEPEIYIRACKELNAIPEKTLAIEDSFNGVRSAYAAGLKVIMVPDILMPDSKIEKMLFKKFDTLIHVKDYLISAK